MYTEGVPDVYIKAYPMYTPGHHLSTGIYFKVLDAFAMPLAVGFNEVKEVGTGVDWLNALLRYPVEVLAMDIRRRTE